MRGEGLKAMSDQLSTYLVLAALLFSIGLFGLLYRRSLIGMLISLELMLNSVNINLVAFDRFMTPDKGTGQIFAIFVIAIAAAEAAVGLSIILAFFRRYKSIDVEQPGELKG